MKTIYLKFASLALLSITCYGPLEGSTFLWVGTDGFLDEPTNWSPVPPGPTNLPTATDTGNFDLSGSHSPGMFELGDDTFDIGQIQITDTVTPYVFEIASGDFHTLIFSLHQNGVTNLTSLIETININDSGFSSATFLQFLNSSSADSTSSGKMVYNIEPACKLFFHDSSTASNAAINLNNAELDFFDSSNPNQAVISLANDSVLNFSTTTKSSNGGPFLTLFDISVVNVNNSNRIAALNSSSTTAQVNIGTQTLTIKQPSDQQDTYAGQLNGTGIFNLNNVDSTSVLILTGDNCTNFTGTTNIKHGHLTLDGSLGGQINVSGVLSGTGTACNTVEVRNGGIIVPGDDAIGTLTAGDYVHNKKGFYLTLLNGNGNSSLIDASASATNGTGQATLHGGTVIAASPNGKYLIDTPYLIVHADHGVAGKYTRAVQEINPFLTATLSYDPKDVFLTLNTNFSGITHTENQEEVAEQIDSIHNPSAAEQAFLQDLVTLTPAQLRRVFDELSGVQYTSIFPTFQKATERFIHALDLPTRLTLADPCEEDACDCYELWGDVQYGRSYIKGDRNAKGYKQQNINGYIATQMKVGCNSKVGAAVYYENDILRFHLNGKSRNNIVLGSVFGIYQTECFYFLSDFIGGYFHGNYRRHIDFDHDHILTRSHPKAYNGAYYGELGLSYFDCCSIGLQPFIGAEGGWYHIQSFEENGGGLVNLHGKNQNYRTADSFLGLRLATDMCGLDFIGEAAWQHSYTSWGNHIKLEFDHFGDEFRIRGPKQGRDGFVGNLTVAMDASDCIKIYAKVDGEKWEHYSTYSVGLGIDVIW